MGSGPIDSQAGPPAVFGPRRTARSADVHGNAAAGIAVVSPICNIISEGRWMLALPPPDRAQALAFRPYPDRPDGLLYSSLQHAAFFCIALFDRGGAAVRAARTMPLLRHPELERALRHQPAGA